MLTTPATPAPSAIASDSKSGASRSEISPTLERTRSGGTMFIDRTRTAKIAAAPIATTTPRIW